MPENIKEEYTGGVIDKSLSKDTEADILSLDNGTVLLKKIKKLIGEYRFWRKARESEPNKSTTIRHLKNINSDILDLINQLRLLPQRTIANMDIESYQRHHESYFSIQQRLESDLYKTLFLLSGALGKEDNRKQKKGSKSRKHEHILLAKVAILLRRYTGMKVNESAVNAASILNDNTEPLYTDYSGNRVRSNFPDDDDKKEAARIVRNAIKKYGLNSSKLD